MKAIVELGFAIILGYTLGWIIAHSTVATECERLGAFYVGSKTFTCSVMGEQHGSN